MIGLDEKAFIQARAAFGLIDEASGHEPFYFGKVNDVEDYAIAGEQYVRLSDYASLRAENEALRARLASIRDETLEEAAKRCEALSWHIDMSPDHIRSRRPEDYAAAIRALQTKGQTNG
jgi:hypothetical protein